MLKRQILLQAVKEKPGMKTSHYSRVLGWKQTITSGHMSLLNQEGLVKRLKGKWRLVDEQPLRTQKEQLEEGLFKAIKAIVDYRVEAEHTRLLANCSTLSKEVKRLEKKIEELKNAPRKFSFFNTEQ